MNLGLIGLGVVSGIITSGILFFSRINIILFLLLLAVFIAIFMIGLHNEAVDPNLAWSISVIYLIVFGVRLYIYIKTSY